MAVREFKLNTTGIDNGNTARRVAKRRAFNAGDRRVAIPAQIFFDPYYLTNRMTTPHVYGALVAAEEASEGKATYEQVRKRLQMSEQAIGFHLRDLRDRGYLEADDSRISLRDRVRTVRYPRPVAIDE